VDFKEVKEIAKKEKWEPIEGVSDPYMVSFSRSFQGHPARINVWIGKRGITVGTYINHPKQGKTQLFRRHVTKKLMKKLFKNPREHTSHGYKNS